MENVGGKETTPITEFSPKQLFVCFDGSEHSVRALATALSIASKFGSSVLVGHAIPFPLNVYGLGEVYYEWDKFEKSERSRIEKILEPFSEQAKKTNINLEVMFLNGIISTADSLLRESEKSNADLILIGSRGLGGFKGLMLGSVSQAVAAYSKVPVIIIK